MENEAKIKICPNCAGIGVILKEFQERPHFSIRELKRQGFRCPYCKGHGRRKCKA